MFFFCLEGQTLGVLHQPRFSPKCVFFTELIICLFVFDSFFEDFFTDCRT